MRIVQVAALIGTCVLASGCQNNVEITVEHVQGMQTTRLAPDSRLGRQVDAAYTQLFALAEACNSAVDKIDDFVASVPSDKFEFVESTFVDARDVISGTAVSATNHMEDCRSFLKGDGETSIVDRAPEIRAKLLSISAFLKDRQVVLKSYAAAGMEIDAIRGFIAGANVEADIRKLDELAVNLETAVEAASNVDPLRVGFGGFAATDVYAITPSDPAYEEILNSAKFSKRPITSATVNVSGNSSIMLVMEHPGQFRIYQISNDPTQLAKNVAFIVSKAAEGAARFSGIGLP